jgi:hypothetical protein
MIKAGQRDTTMRARIAAVIFLLQTQSVWAVDCAEVKRQAEPKKAALQATAKEYKSRVTAGLLAALSGKDPPPMAAIAQALAEQSKMISAIDTAIRYFRSVMSAGCFGKEAGNWSNVIATFEAQRVEMGKDRRCMSRSSVTGAESMGRWLRRWNWGGLLDSSELVSWCA